MVVRVVAYSAMPQPSVLRELKSGHVVPNVPSIYLDHTSLIEGLQLNVSLPN